MATSVALPRGINLGATNRIAMPALRAALAEGGFTNVRTYVQSGNIVLDSEPDDDGMLAARVAGLIAERFGLHIAVVVRSRAELAAVVDSDPLPEATRGTPTVSRARSYGRNLGLRAVSARTSRPRRETGPQC